MQEIRKSFNNIEPTKIYPATYNILTSPITQLDSYQDIRSSSIESDLNFCSACDCDSIQEILDIIKKEGSPNSELVCECYSFFLPKYGIDALQKLKP